MKHLCILVLMVLILPIAYPISYYIDEKITISENGDAYIKGTTNVDLLADVHPVNENIDGRTSELTSKKAKYWLFSYDSKSNLSASYIQVSLPKGAVKIAIESDCYEPLEKALYELCYTGRYESAATLLGLAPKLKQRIKEDLLLYHANRHLAHAYAGDRSSMSGHRIRIAIGIAELSDLTLDYSNLRRVIGRVISDKYHRDDVLAAVDYLSKKGDLKPYEKEFILQLVNRVSS